MARSRISLAAGAAILLALAAAGCKPATSADSNTEPKAEASIGGLTTKNLYGPLRMSAADRERYVDRCTARLSIARGFGVFAIQGSVRDLNNVRTAAALRGCACLVSQMEDRASGLQFLMFLDTLALARGAPLPTMPNYKSYWNFALANGMTAEGFRETTNEMVKMLNASAHTCARV